MQAYRTGEHPEQAVYWNGGFCSKYPTIFFCVCLCRDRALEGVLVPPTVPHNSSSLYISKSTSEATTSRTPNLSIPTKRSMRCFLPGLCALATASILLAPSTIIVEAAVVDAGALTDVSVDAAYFDDQTDDCGSDGCYGALTRVRYSSSKSSECKIIVDRVRLTTLFIGST